MEKIQQAIERARQQRTGRPSAAPTDRVALDEHAARLDLQTLPVFTVDPRRAQTTHLVTMSADAGHADLFRMLRTQLVQRMRVLGARSVAVLSPRNGEGKTLTACNLAVSMARQGTGPVFLLDFDFRRPTVHEVFGLEVLRGISSVIEGTTAVDQVLQRCGDLPLYVAPQGRPHPGASELVAAKSTAALLRELEESHADSIVVVDSPPLLLTDEPLTLQQMVGACLLVVQQGRTKREDVQRAAELIDETKYVGSVMNRVRESDLNDGYGYGYR